MGFIGRARTAVRRWDRLSRPDPELVAALARRWDGLPASARTRGQALGRHTVGCEGTHGVFPRCNLKCTPCYHSREANQVRVDGEHTLREVTAQMGLLRRLRGPRAHAQLIGGEVTLLPPDDHAAALLAMRAAGREPMSLSHGDVDEEYLQALALGPDGRRRFDRLSFAGHFDKMMYGRRGIERPPSEAALDPYRRALTAKFARLRREHGVRSFLAHNMTVTPANLDEVAGVIRANLDDGWGMFSFQPAAFLGDDRRWRESYRAVTPDAVWAEIERGAGAEVDFTVIEHGDVRCNRTAYGVVLGGRWHPLLDGRDPADLAARDAFFARFGPIAFAGTAPRVLLAQVGRVVVRHPGTAVVVLRWAVRLVRRLGVRRLVRSRDLHPVSFVMHQFMDAADVAPAWEAMQRGQTSTDPHLRSVQERLGACHYAMAHPEDGTLVPACVQHAVLDPGENAALRRELPLLTIGRRPPAAPAAAGRA